MCDVRGHGSGRGRSFSPRYRALSKVNKHITTSAHAERTQIRLRPHLRFAISSHIASARDKSVPSPGASFRPRTSAALFPAGPHLPVSTEVHAFARHKLLILCPCPSFCKAQRSTSIPGGCALERHIKVTLVLCLSERASMRRRRCTSLEGRGQ